MTVKNIFKTTDTFERSSFAEDKQIVTDSLRIISSEHTLTPLQGNKEATILNDLSHFESFRLYAQVLLYKSFEIAADRHKFHLAIISINTSVERVSAHQIRREGMTEWEFVGMTTLTKDYGCVYIRPETQHDKLIELIYPVEVDFDIDPEFSRKYYVLTPG
ncbi:MAG: hypothetical protein KDD36_12895 [Flavobacteriales bacterium]|nr:hypothetical protein [Flavobacteriales bacterium]